MVSAVIVAAGSGTRMNAGMNKIFMELDGKTVIEHTLSAFLKSRADEIIVVASPLEIDEMKRITDKYSVDIMVVPGGHDRQHSVFNALGRASGEVVCIHDGARCLVTPELIDSAIDDCLKYGAAAVGVSCKDTMKLIDSEGCISSTVDRDLLFMIQTPQVFMKDRLLEYHKRAEREGVVVTDDSALYELYGGKVYISGGSYDNIKITTPEDIFIAGEILKRRKSNA